MSSPPAFGRPALHETVSEDRGHPARTRGGRDARGPKFLSSVRRAVFLDRDGVINRAVVRNGKPYPPPSLEAFELLPGVVEAVAALRAAGYLIVVATNQPDVATGKQKHNQPQQTSPRGRIPKSATLIDRMKRKLATKAGRAIYARRKTIVEPVFGQIKQAQGFRLFLLRGAEKARGEWALVCTTHNLLKLYRVCTA